MATFTTQEECINYIKENMYKDKLDVLKYENSLVSKVTRNLINNKEFPILAFKEHNNFFAFELNVITPDDTFKILITGKKDVVTVYSDYLVNPKTSFKLKITKQNDNGYHYICLTTVNNIYNNESIENNVSTFTRVFLRTINIGNFILFDDFDVSNDQMKDIYANVPSEVIQTIDIDSSKEARFGVISEESDPIGHSVKVPFTPTEDMYMNYIDVDVGNCKLIGKVAKQSDDLLDRDVENYEDSKVKGPVFLYPIFYNSGLPFDKFVRFDGSIIVNGYIYSVNYVRISAPTDENHKYGIVQFMLDRYTKFIGREAKKGYYEESEMDAKDGKFFGITFYPILTSDGNLSYNYIDQIKYPNSYVSQETTLNCIYKDYIKDSVGERDIIENRFYSNGKYCFICTKNSIDLIDCKTCRVITSVSNQFITDKEDESIIYINKMNTPKEIYDFYGDLYICVSEKNSIGIIYIKDNNIFSFDFRTYRYQRGIGAGIENIDKITFKNYVTSAIQTNYDIAYDYENNYLVLSNSQTVTFDITVNESGEVTKSEATIRNYVYVGSTYENKTFLTKTEITEDPTNKYEIQDHETVISFKLKDDSNEYILKNNRYRSDKLSLFTYNKDFVSNDNLNRVENVNIVPATVQTVNGILFIEKEDLRKDFKVKDFAQYSE